MIVDWWLQLSVLAQDSLLLACLLLLPVLVLLSIQWRYPLHPVVIGLLRRHQQAVIAMLALISVATAITLVFALQERALKTGSARVSDKFDLIIAAPGSQVDVLLAAVYLQPSALPMLKADTLSRLSSHPDVRFAAPVASGDQINGTPLIGTTSRLVSHLLNVPEQQWFESMDQVLAGSNTPFVTGDTFKPQHGFSTGDSVEHHSKLDVIRRLPSTGTRWDHALIVPVEALWKMHGISTHDARVPIVVVAAKTTGALYGLRQEFNNNDTMAFFPAEVLSRLYSVLGSIADVVTALTLATQLLVVLSVLLSVFILMRSMATRFATLHALGAPPLFRFCLIWAFTAVLIVTGIVLGVLLGGAGAVALAQWFSTQTPIPVKLQVGLSDFVAIVLFLDITLIMACLPAWSVSRQRHDHGLHS